MSSLITVKEGTKVVYFDDNNILISIYTSDHEPIDGYSSAVVPFDYEGFEYRDNNTYFIPQVSTCFIPQL